MGELGWPQTTKQSADKWGVDSEKLLRSMKAQQEKGLRRIACYSTVESISCVLGRFRKIIQTNNVFYLVETLCAVREVKGSLLTIRSGLAMITKHVL